MVLEMFSPINFIDDYIKKLDCFLNQKNSLAFGISCQNNVMVKLAPGAIETISQVFVAVVLWGCKQLLEGPRQPQPCSGLQLVADVDDNDEEPLDAVDDDCNRVFVSTLAFGHPVVEKNSIESVNEPTNRIGVQFFKFFLESMHQIFVNKFS